MGSATGSVQVNKTRGYVALESGGTIFQVNATGISYSLDGGNSSNSLPIEITGGATALTPATNYVMNSVMPELEAIPLGGQMSNAGNDMYRNTNFNYI